jgi:hypothetical protein
MTQTDTCPRCGSSRQTPDSGGNPDLYFCGSTERYQSTECSYMSDNHRLMDLANAYRDALERIVTSDHLPPEDLRQIAADTLRATRQ